MNLTLGIPELPEISEAANKALHYNYCLNTRDQRIMLHHAQSPDGDARQGPHDTSKKIRALIVTRQPNALKMHVKISFRNGLIAGKSKGSGLRFCPTSGCHRLLQRSSWFARQGMKLLCKGRS